MKFKTTLRLKSNIIDPAPFVNVMVLFAAFFILCSNQRGLPGLVMDLPIVEQRELYNADSVVVAIFQDKVFLNENEIDTDKLQEELTRIKPQVLAIKADKDIPHSRVTEIISMARHAGIKKIAIAAEGER